MIEPQPQRTEVQAIDPKVELANAQINLANTRYAVKIQEAVVAKLEELVKAA